MYLWVDLIQFSEKGLLVSFYSKALPSKARDLYFVPTKIAMDMKIIHAFEYSKIRASRSLLFPLYFNIIHPSVVSFHLITGYLSLHGMVP